MPPITHGTKPKNAKGAMLRLLSYLGKYRLVIGIVLVMAVLSNILSLLGPSLAGNAINEAAAGVGKVNFDRVWYYAKRMLICYAASSILTIAINVLMMKVSKWIARNLRKDIFDKLMRLPVGFFDRNSAGDIISRSSYDVDVISTSLGTDIVSIITSSVTVVGSLFMMITISPVMSLIVLVTIPVSVFYTVYMRKRTRPRFSKRSKNYGAMNGFVEEMFSGQKTIQSYAYEEHADDRFDGVNSAAADAYFDAEYYGVAMGPTMGCINNVSLGLVATLGSVLYMNGLASLGQISSFVLYSRKFSGPINEIANIVNEIFSALSAAERIFELLDSEEESADAENALPLSNVRGDVAMSHVSFGYTPQRIILKDLSLEAEAGKLIAIVGPTGAGKTTIINLLMRFYDPKSGQITVDGQDIRDCQRASLRTSWSMVLQDTWVFRGTIFDNIAYGKQDATMEEVQEAAKAAHIHPFIMRLPDGYNTIISEDGGNISKGQKQLLTIARAMLYDARMLILDEATSNVDTGTERQIQAAMRKLMSNKTCFVIAHRLSTIQHADRILVLNEGDVVEQGTHAELMEKKGFYYNLYSAQFE